MFMMNFIAVLLLACAILIRFFRCHWLIAGYNTASEEHRKNVDWDGTGRFMGNGLFVLAALIYAHSLLVTRGVENTLLLFTIFPGLFVVVIIYLIIGAQKYNYNRRRKGEGL